MTAKNVYGNASVPGTWWKGHSHMIEPSSKIRVGETDLHDACNPNSGDITKDECMHGVSNFEQVEKRAKNGDKHAKEFITEMFFRCWWHKPAKVAKEFNRKGWEVDGEPVDESNVGSLCLKFQDAGYGDAGWKSKR